MAEDVEGNSSEFLTGVSSLDFCWQIEHFASFSGKKSRISQTIHLKKRPTFIPYSIRLMNGLLYSKHYIFMVSICN